MTDGVAIVTGAGAGLGRALATGLVAKGITVVGLGRNGDALAETGRLAGKGFHPVIADVADPAAVSVAFAQTDAIGPVTLLINNAAVYPRRDILDETPDSFRDTMAVNLGGVVACTHEALGRMVRTGQGRIVNVASFADIAPIAASSAYSVSKGAARVFTRAVVADLGDRFPGIVITEWLPGRLATRMGVADGLDPATAAAWGVQLALWTHRSLNGTTWEMDTEVLPPQSLKDRIKDNLMFRSARAPRKLG